MLGILVLIWKCGEVFLYILYHSLMFILLTLYCNPLVCFTWIFIFTSDWDPICIFCLSCFFFYIELCVRIYVNNMRFLEECTITACIWLGLRVCKHIQWNCLFSLYVFRFPMLQINEEASDKVLEVEQKYNEIRKPIYDKRNDIIKSIPDFWLTAVSVLSAVSLREYIN